MSLSHTVKTMENRVHDLERVFYHAHSFMSSPNAVDCNGNPVSACNGFKMVDKLIACEQETLDDIAICKYKLRQFTRYYDTLPMDDKRCLVSYFLFHDDGVVNDALNRRTLEEIGQIEESTAWRFNLEPDVHMVTTADVKTNLGNMLDVLEVMA